MSEPQESFRDLYERVKDEPIRINTFRILTAPDGRTKPHVIARELPAVRHPTIHGSCTCTHRNRTRHVPPVSRARPCRV
jgi:hypothetical protein